MEISGLQWGITIAVILGLLAYDFIFHARKPHEPTINEAALWTSLYVSLALLFGLIVLIWDGPGFAAEYYAGFITEQALSVDNLFVFLIIMASFKVPRADQQKVLLFGIVVALIARTLFIFVGAAAINRWSALFYVFGIFLIYTAGNLVKGEVTDADEEDGANNVMVRLAKRFLKTTDEYDGDKLFTEVDGKRMMTPMLLVMVAIGLTDIMFALDSIPAIFGLTQETYIVFTATAFSLMGLRQLYFLIDGLLDRLIYLSWGLALILGFIGVKLILHALHENTLSFINGGEPVHVVEVSTGFSLAVIIGVLVLTVLASLYSPKGRAVRIINGAQLWAERYLDTPESAPVEERTKAAQKMNKYRAQLPNVKEKYRDELIESETRYHDLLERAHGLREQRIADAKGRARN